jgi:hypothetical protein
LGLFCLRSRKSQVRILRRALSLESGPCSAGTGRVPDVGEDAVERPGYLVEIQRLDERREQPVVVIGSGCRAESGGWL